MLLERTECTVPEGSREAFDRAQRAFRPSRYVDGLVVQVGGYEIGEDKGGRACLVAVWRDRGSYDRYLENAHEAVAAAAGREAHCEGLEVKLFDVVSRMPGQRPRTAEAFSAGRLLRWVDHEVQPDSVNAFLYARLDVWTPGMAAAKGMLGGVLGRVPGAPHFVSVSSFEEESLHDLYAQHHRPTLQERAGLAEDAVVDTARQFAVERHWTVIGVGTG